MKICSTICHMYISVGEPREARWQNQVIDTFIHDQLVGSGYTDAGKGETTSDRKSSNDMSSAKTGDYAWVTYFNDIDTLTWDPEYAKLEVSGGR